MRKNQYGGWLNRISHLRTPLLISGLTLTLPSQATDYDADEADYLSEVPILISATRLKQPLNDIPASVTILDSDLIEASGVTDLPALFRLIPGYLAYSVFGGQFGVSNRGIGTEFPGDLEIMVDGRSVYEPFFAAVEWSSLGIGVQDIAYIEAVRGSHTPVYGSNAFLGAINIITKNPLQTKGTQVSIEVGDLQTHHATLRQQLSFRNLEMRFGLNYRADAGFPAQTSVTTPFDQIDDDRVSLNGWVKGLYTPSINHTLEFQLGLGESTLHLPYPAPFGDVQGYNERRFTSDHQLLKWTHQIDENDEFSLQFYHNRLSLDEYRQLGPLSQTESIAPAQIPVLFPGRVDQPLAFDLRDTQSDRSDLELQRSKRLNENMRSVIGLGVRYDWLRSTFLLGRKDPIDETQYRLFGHLEWCLHPKWNINLGAMYESNNIAGEFFSPRVALNYKAAEQQSLHIAYSHSHRTPSIIEANQIQATRFEDGVLINAQFVSNAGIDESEVKEVEIGYRAQGIESQLKLDLRLFHTEARGVIGKFRGNYPDLDGRALFVGNTDSWRNQGLDLQLQWRPTPATRVSLQYAYSDFSGRRLLQNQPESVGKMGQEIPRHNTSLIVQHQFTPNWSASLIGYALSSVEWRDGARLPTQERIDLRLAYRFRLSQRIEGNWELIAHNLLDDYVEYKAFNRFETRLFSRLSLHF